MSDNAVTALILGVFQLNGRLLAAGDALVADLGLTSARWQILGAAALSPFPLTVARIARNMGLSRQAVQRVANELAADGIIRFAPNPHHARAQLVLLTPEGETKFADAQRRQRRWAAGLAEGLDEARLRACASLLQQLSQRLDPDLTSGEQP